MSKVQFKKIRNWTDLQEEKRRLTTHLDAREDLLKERWGKIRDNGKDILYNKVLIPLSLMGIGAVLIRLFRSMADHGGSSGEHTAETPRQKTTGSTRQNDRTSKGWFSSENIEVMAQAAKILLPVVIAAFASQDESEDQEREAMGSEVRQENIEVDNEEST